MKSSSNISTHRSLPLIHDLKRDYVLSFIILILMVAVSIAGLLYPYTLYPTDDLMETFMANDVVNLFIGLPIILGAIWFTRRDRLIGLLIWPGALLYVIYNYIGYTLGVPFYLITFVYLVLVILSAYTLVDLLVKTDQKSVKIRLSGFVPEKLTGWILVAFGVLFIFRAIFIVAPAIMNQTTLPAAEIGVLVADIVVSILWIIGGVLLLRRSPLGYLSGLGLLFAASMLFIGLIMFLLLQPVLTDTPFVLTDVITILVMGLICFIPFGLYVRGVLSGEKATQLENASK
jgi:hypothetical protein